MGPTAVGKSALAVDLAQKFRGEIISCDSRQIYRGFDIGTDKPPVLVKQAVPHYLIDVVDPEETFSAADFSRLALEEIDRILSRGIYRWWWEVPVSIIEPWWKDSSPDRDVMIV